MLVHKKKTEKQEPFELCYVSRLCFYHQAIVDQLCIAHRRNSLPTFKVQQQISSKSIHFLTLAITAESCLSACHQTLVYFRGL